MSTFEPALRARGIFSQQISKTVPGLRSIVISIMAAAVTKQKLSTAKFAVLGGGISGLTAAYRLLNRVKDPSNIIVLESSNRVGGWVQSCVTEHGAVFELGPRSIRPVGKAGMATLKMVCMTQVRNVWTEF